MLYSYAEDMAVLGAALSLPSAHWRGILQTAHHATSRAATDVLYIAVCMHECQKLQFGARIHENTALVILILVLNIHRPRLMF